MWVRDSSHVTLPWFEVCTLLSMLLTRPVIPLWISFTFQSIFGLIWLETFATNKKKTPHYFHLVRWSPITGSSPNPPPSLISPLTSFTAAVRVSSKMWSLCGLKLHCLNRWKPQNPSPFLLCALGTRTMENMCNDLFWLTWPWSGQDWLQMAAR